MTTRARLRCLCLSPVMVLLLGTGCAKKEAPAEVPAESPPVLVAPAVTAPPKAEGEPPPTAEVTAPPKTGGEPPPSAPPGAENTVPPPRVGQPVQKGYLAGLIAQLQHADPRERAAAAQALGEKGAPAHPAIHALLAALDDEDADVRARADAAIVAIGHTKTNGLVDFSAAWCGPCRTVKPIVEKLKGEGLPVLMVDIDKHPQLAEQFKIRFVPTFVVIRADKEARRSTGASSEEALREMLKGTSKSDATPATLGLGDSAAQARVLSLLLALTGEDEWIKFLAEEEVTSPRRQAGPVLAQVVNGKYPDRVRVGAVKGLLVSYQDRAVPAEVAALLKDQAARAGASVDVRGYVSVALHKLKIKDAGAAPALKTALEKGTRTELRELAAESLGELQVVEAVPALTGALADESRRVRKAAVGALRLIGARSAPAVPRLIKLFGAEPESDVGEAAKQALQEIVPSAPDVAPTLIAALKSQELPTRLLAVELLNTVDDPQPAAASLQLLLDDTDVAIRTRAAITLQRLGQADVKVLRVLVSSLNEEQENYEASDALRSAGRKVVPLLTAGLVHPNATARYRLRAVRSFSGVEKPDKATVETLTKALTAKEPNVSTCAALALAWRSPTEPALVGPLAAGLKSPDPELRRECAHALGRTQSKAAVAPLLAALQKDGETRDPAAHALAQLPRDEAAVATLVKMLKDPKTRPPAVRALVSLREHQDAAARALIAVFTGAEPEERETIGYTLQSLGNPAATQLVALFEDAQAKTEVRLEALTVAGGMREESREGVPGLDKYLKDPNQQIRQRAAVTLALQNTDADVADILCDVIEKETDHSSLRSDAQRALSALGPKAAGTIDRQIGWLKGPDAERRNVATRTLPAVGRESPKALSALVALLKSTEDQNVRRSVAYSLYTFEERGAAELLKALSDSAYSRPDVIAALRQLGSRAKAAREPLTKLLGDPDRAVAIAAALALSSIDPKAEAAVPVLVEGMRSSDRDTSFQALEALGGFGARARVAVPELVRALEKQDSRHNALHALARIGPDAAGAVDALTRLLNSRDADSAANALGAIGPAAAPSVPKLLRMLQNERTAYSAAVALGKIGGDAKRAVPLLVVKLNQDDEAVAACRALASVGRLDVDETLPALRKVTTHSDPELRAAAVGTLGQLKSDKAVPDVLAAMKDPELSVRLAAVHALGQLGAGSEAAVTTLTEALGAKEPSLRQNAAWALGHLGPKADGAVPALVKALSDKEVGVAATYALGRIGPAAGAAVPRFIELLDDPDRRYEVVHALGQIGSAAKAALPKLRRLAKDSNAELAKAAASAADRIEGKSAPPIEDESPK